MMNKKGVLFFLLITLSIWGQEPTVDTLKVETLDEVLLQAIRVKPNAPFAHSNLNKEAISKRNLGQDIPVLLSYLPSVVTTTDAGAGVGYTYMRVRGSDGSRINVTINGIPFNDAESQGTFWVDLPDFASSVQSLQLQRGVGTSTNGSGAFGASLNILSDAVSEKAYGQIASSFGSFNTKKYNLKFSTGLLNDYIEISGRLSKITSDGYIDRAWSDLKSYFLQGTFINNDTQIKALVFGGKEKTYQAWYGIDKQTLESDRTFNPAGQYTDPDGNIRFYDNEIDNYNQDHYQLHWNQRYNNHWSSNLGLNYTKGSGYFEQYKEDADMQFHNLEPITVNGILITETDLIRRRWLDNDFYVVTANATYKKNKLEITSGGFYSSYDGDHFGEVIWAQYAGNTPIRNKYYKGNGRKFEATFFSKISYNLTNKFTIFGDLQERFVTYKTNGLTSDKVPLSINKKYSFFNPKAGINIDLNTANSFYFSYGKAHREPRRSDFENGITKPEILNDFETGWRFNSKKLKLNTGIFYMYYKDQMVLTGAIDDVGAPIRETSGKSYRLGIEIDAAYKVTKQLELKPNLSLSSNKNIDFYASIDGNLVNLGNTTISYSPAIVAGNIATYKVTNNMEVSFLSKYVSEQYMGNIDSETSKLDAYFVNDLNVVYTLKNIPYVNELVFTGLVNNVFNTKYVSNGYFFTYDDTWSQPGTTTTIEGAGYYPQATRNFLIGAQVRF